MATKGERSEPRAEDTTYRRPEACDPKGGQAVTAKGKKIAEYAESKLGCVFPETFMFSQIPFFQKTT